MNIFQRKNIPFVFLLVISFVWTFYYQSSNIMNDYGKTQPEWLLLIDGLVVLPLLCFLCIKNNNEAAIKALAYSCLVIFLGSLILPENSKVVWRYLESGRYLVIAAFVLIEMITILTVFLAIKTSLAHGKDPDLAISKPIEATLGKGNISAMISFEARVWTYVLFAKKIDRQDFYGDNHFSCHLKDGGQSNLLGFIVIILFELPIMHVVVHFLWSPVAANIVTLLTLLSLVFFLAEYRAIAIRPISIAVDSVIVRYGVFNPLMVSFCDIDAVQLNAKVVYRASHIKRFNGAGNPNVEIKMNSGNLVYLGLDSPVEFINVFNKARAKWCSEAQ